MCDETKTNREDWYVLYTLFQHESKVRKLLARDKIETFLPQYVAERKWSDRIKKVKAPLFPNYLFIKLRPCLHWKVLQLPGALNFISNGGIPTVVCEDTINSIREMALLNPLPIDDSFCTDQEVYVKAGPLKDLKGTLVTIKGKTKLAVKLELMNRTVLVDLQSDQIERTSRRRSLTTTTATALRAS